MPKKLQVKRILKGRWEEYTTKLPLGRITAQGVGRSCQSWKHRILGSGLGKIFPGNVVLTNALSPFCRITAVLTETRVFAPSSFFALFHFEMGVKGTRTCER